MKIEAEIADGVLVFRVPYRVVAVPENSIDIVKRLLTDRELQVFLQIRQGKTNKEVGNTLDLSERLVKYVAKRIYAKLGCSTRAELAFKYAQ